MWIALVPMLAWGSIGLVSGKMGGDAHQQTLGMTFGALIFAIVTTIFSFQHFLQYNSFKLWAVGIVSGLCWCLGQNNQFKAMKAIGVSKAVPISTGAQLVTTTIAGAIFFHEWTTTRQLGFGFLALLFLVSGVVFTSLRDKSKADDDGIKEDRTEGAKTLIVSTIGFLLYTVVVTLFSVNTKAMILPQAVGMVLGGFIFSYRKNSFEKPMYKNMLTGLFWGAGNFCMFQATVLVGLAISFSLAQSGIVISTFGSIFLLGEKKTRKEMVYVTIGSILVSIGSIILGMLK